MNLRFGSVCSGIEAATVAWGPLGRQAAWLSEIEPWPSKLLAHHYPDTPNLGDMRALPAAIRAGAVEAPDVLCGGTPCQAFSVAGLRNSLDDDRGNLTLTYCDIANAIDEQRTAAGLPECITFWENVPGVLSTRDNAFGCFLGQLAGDDQPMEPEARPAPGKSSRCWRWADGAHSPSWPVAGAVVGPSRTVAWRVLDSQYFGVAQRRRRVFVVASARKGFNPLAVLFEWEGLRRDTAPSREAGEDAAAGTLRSTQGGCDVDHVRAGHVVGTLTASHGPAGHGGGGLATNGGAEAGRLIPVQAFGSNNTAGAIPVAAALNANRGCHNPGDFEAGTLLVCDTTQITSLGNRSNPQPGDPVHTLAGGAHPPLLVAFHHNAQAAQLPTESRGPEVSSSLTCSQQAAVAFQERGRAGGRSLEIGGDVAYALTAPSGGGRAQERNVMTPAMQVRHLTPMECERLQAFPDGYSDVPGGSDSARYKALGNSWTTKPVHWIGQRIENELK